jgi:hypothetical protein
MAIMFVVGNDRDGWTYYSKYDDPGARINKDDGPEGIYDSRTTTSNGNYKQSYDTLQDFYNDQAVSGQYNRSVEIITTPAQDAAMKNTGNKIYDTPYDLATNNCADLVENITFSGKINLYSDFLGFGSITIPNDQYKVAEGIAESSSGYSTNDDLNYNTMRVNFKISSKK